MSMLLRLNLLGGFSLICDDTPVMEPNSPRLQSLIACLALHRGAPQPRQRIAFILWPDSTEMQARTNLRNLIHQLRQVLPQATDIWCFDGRLIQWHPNLSLSLDVSEFEQTCVKHEFDRAVQVYRGELLPECYDDWIMPERERLQQMYVEALRQTILQKESTRDYQTAIEYANRLLRTEPLREGTYRDLMRLYALSGDRVGIVRAYHLCTTNLRKELDLEPGVATRTVYEHCLQQLSIEKLQAGKTVPALLLNQATDYAGQIPAKGKSEPVTGNQYRKMGVSVLFKNSSRQVLAVLLGGGASNLLGILLENRAKPALPFGGQYRIIDFALSNVTNSGLPHVAVAMQHRPHSLIKHLGRGEPWDLAHDHSASLEIWQPYRGRQDQGWYRGTADALYQNRDFIREAGCEFVLILAADHVYKQDYREIISFHEEYQADLTIATMPVCPEDAPRFGVLNIDADRRITKFIEKPANPSSTLASLGIYIFRTSFLLSLLEEDAHDSTSRHDFGQNIIPGVIEHARACAYPFSGYWADIGSIAAYWESNLALLTGTPALNVDDPSWPIHTRVEARPPVRCRQTGVIENSLVSVGCLVEGTVINSVLSPGVHIARGAVVRDSVIMRNTFIESGACVERCILDEEVKIGREAQIGVGHDNTPNYLDPQNLYAGITLVGRRAHIRPGAIVGLNCRIDPDVTPEDFQQTVISSGSTVSVCPQQL